MFFFSYYHPPSRDWSSIPLKIVHSPTPGVVILFTKIFNKILPQDFSLSIVNQFSQQSPLHLKSPAFGKLLFIPIIFSKQLMVFLSMFLRSSTDLEAGFGGT